MGFFVSWGGRKPIFYMGLAIEKLEQLIASMGYEFVGREIFSQGGRQVMRIYIDRTGGITVDDCAKVSAQVGALMEVESQSMANYVLEVSSPGIHRPLFELKHFEKFIGSQIKVKLRSSINGRRQYKGLLKAVIGDKIALIVEDTGELVELPFSTIEKSNVVGDIHF